MNQIMNYINNLFFLGGLCGNKKEKMKEKKFKSLITCVHVFLNTFYPACPVIPSNNKTIGNLSSLFTCVPVFLSFFVSIWYLFRAGFVPVCVVFNRYFSLCFFAANVVSESISRFFTVFRFFKFHVFSFARCPSRSMVDRPESGGIISRFVLNRDNQRKRP
jgi:hypothetical protein